MRPSPFMEAALAQAQSAALRGEVPIGAVVVQDGAILASAGNRTRELADPTAHAEMLVIREACRLTASERLPQADLYVTLEPCPMCASAISFARIRRLYFGASDEKGGAVTSGIRLYSQPICHHAPEVYSGLAELQVSEMLKSFFRQKR